MDLSTVEAKMWSRVPRLIDTWLEKTAAPAKDIRQATSLVYTKSDIGYYWNPETQQAGMFGRLFPTKQDVSLCKMALDRAVGADHVRPELLDFDEVAQGHWVKVAFSPTLRRTGELLNFFPGKYPGGIPNAPSPLAATLTGGLTGAGLGYGLGWLGEKVLPGQWSRGKLRRTLAILGGGMGAAPGALWGLSASKRGRSLLDGSDTADLPDREQFSHLDEYDTQSQFKAAADVLADVELGLAYRTATEGFVKKAFGTFNRGFMDDRPETPIDVNLNRMGQTLWEVGANPQTTASTMGALYAAQQLPDDNAQPGRVTPHQTGLLGTMMGAAGGGMKGYAAGYLAGKALGILTGAPAGLQNSLKQTGAVLGIVNSVVPRLFN